MPLRVPLESAGVIRSTTLDLIEINEAFAAQIVQNVRALDLDEERVNVNGGGIALGIRPGRAAAGCVVSLLDELERRDATLGAGEPLCGGGMGVAAVIERLR